MFDLGLGSLISGGISAVGNLISGISSSKKGLQAVQETNQANRELAEYQYEKNLEMWERQNVYNSPIEQMKRIKEAGLNPNLMYGQGTTGNSSSMPSYDAPRMEAYTNFGDFGVGRASQELMQGLMGYAQVKKTEAETNNIRQNTQNLEVQKQLSELQVIQQGFVNSKTREEANVWADLYRSKIANIDSSSVNNFASAQAKDSSRFYTDAQRERFELLTPLVFNSVQADLNQKLFDLKFISPAKLQNLIADTEYKKVLSEIANIKTDILGNELEFSNAELPYKDEKAFYENKIRVTDSQIKDLTKRIQEIAAKHGFKLGGNAIYNAINAVFYSGYK